MTTAQLIELDSLEFTAIVDNELDPISPCVNPAVQQFGGLRDIVAKGKLQPDDVRGGDNLEWRMSNICCSAHGLALMITGTVGDEKRTILFDTGPEEHCFERNATRLEANLGQIEVIQLSHYHRDHSGGMLKALEMIQAARMTNMIKLPPVVVDLHPSRPFYRGAQSPGSPVVSLEADPTFESIEEAGGRVMLSDQAHTVLDGMFQISGEIPRQTTYETGLKHGVRFDKDKGKWEADELLLDERLLMCKLKGKGIVVFTGCAHAGVVNSARHAIELAYGAPLYAVVGGYHLADALPEFIETTANDLLALKPSLLMPGHCTGWRAKFVLHSKMPGQVVPSFVGSRFIL